MCKCDETVPQRLAEQYKKQGVDLVGVPFIEFRHYFKGNKEYYGIAIDTVRYEKRKKRNGEIFEKKVKGFLIPVYCPFCGEKYLKDE